MIHINLAEPKFTLPYPRSEVVVNFGAFKEKVFISYSALFDLHVLQPAIIDRMLKKLEAKK